MIKQYMHRPQSASSRKQNKAETERSKPERVHTEEKDRKMSSRQNKNVHFDEGKNNTRDRNVVIANINDPECILQDSVSRALIDDKDWGRHLKGKCWCGICTCKKHLCQLHPIKMGLSIPQSTYSNNYKDQGSIPNRRINLPMEEKYEPMIVNASNYSSEYPKKQTKIESPNIYKDNLSSRGPMLCTTTYNQNFIQKNAPSQYMQVSKGLNFPVGTPITGQSTYKNNYKWRNGRPSAVVIKQDMMPVQNNLAFLGRSSYQSDYRAPKKDQYPMRVHDPHTLNASMGPLNTQTTYNKQYNHTHLTMCPAQVQRRREMHNYQYS